MTRTILTQRSFLPQHFVSEEIGNNGVGEPKSNTAVIKQTGLMIGGWHLPSFLQTGSIAGGPTLYETR